MSAEGDAAGLVRDVYLQQVLQNSLETRAKTLAVLEQAAGTDASQSEELCKAQKYLESLISRLRGQNRKLAHLVRDTKAATSNSRGEVDKLHLQLQNLYYEQRHLMGEISACENYEHSYLKLPMIALDEFFERFPDWTESGKVNELGEGEGEQDLMKARIKEEQRERMELEDKRQTLLKRKLELVKENAKRKEELTQLDKDLEKFIDAAKPIQKLFEKEY